MQCADHVMIRANALVRVHWNVFRVVTDNQIERAEKRLRSTINLLDKKIQLRNIIRIAIHGMDTNAHSGSSKFSFLYLERTNYGSCVVVSIT